MSKPIYRATINKILTVLCDYNIISTESGENIVWYVEDAKKHNFQSPFELDYIIDTSEPICDTGEKSAYRAVVSGKVSKYHVEIKHSSVNLEDLHVFLPETFLSQSASIGEDVIHVNDQEGFGEGDFIVIEPNTDVEEYNTIIDLGSLILKNKLKYNHARLASVKRVKYLPKVSATPTPSESLIPVTPSSTTSLAPSSTPAETPSSSPQITPSNTPPTTFSITPEVTTSATITSTQAITLTPTYTNTTTPTFTPSVTQTNTQTSSIGATVSPTQTNTKTPTATPSITQTLTPTQTNTKTPTVTPSITQTLTPTQTNTKTATVTPSVTSTSTTTPTFTPSVTQTVTPTQTNTKTPTVTPSVTQTATVTPSVTSTSTTTPTFTPSVTQTNTQSPTFTPSLTQTNTQTVTPTPSVTKFVFESNPDSDIIYSIENNTNNVEFDQPIFGETMQAAVDRWDSIITGYPEGWFLDVYVEYEEMAPNILGGAAITHFNGLTDFGSFFPTRGDIVLNSVNLNAMKNNIGNAGKSELYYTCLHEVGHLLGIGSLILKENSTINNEPVVSYVEDGVTKYYYTGQHAFQAYKDYLAPLGHDTGLLSGIPVEDDGGQGTAHSHAEEGLTNGISSNDRSIGGVFHPGLEHELMAGWSEDGDYNPLSKISIGFLQDIGYNVNYDEADPYSPANPLLGLTFQIEAPANQGDTFLTVLPENQINFSVNQKIIIDKGKAVEETNVVSSLDNPNLINLKYPLQHNHDLGATIQSVSDAVSITSTPTPTLTQTATPSLTPTSSMSPTPSATSSFTVTPSISRTLTPSLTETPTSTPSMSASPTKTPTVTPSISNTLTPSPTKPTVNTDCDSLPATFPIELC